MLSFRAAVQQNTLRLQKSFVLYCCGWYEQDATIFWRCDFELERQQCLLDVVCCPVRAVDVDSASDGELRQLRGVAPLSTPRGSSCIIASSLIAALTLQPRQSDRDEITCQWDFGAKYTEAVSWVLSDLSTVYPIAVFLKLRVSRTATVSLKVSISCNWTDQLFTYKMALCTSHSHPYPYIRLKYSWHIATWLQR